MLLQFITTPTIVVIDFTGDVCWSVSDSPLEFAVSPDKGETDKQRWGFVVINFYSISRFPGNHKYLWPFLSLC